MPDPEKPIGHTIHGEDIGRNNRDTRKSRNLLMHPASYSLLLHVPYLGAITVEEPAVSENLSVLPNIVPFLRRMFWQGN